MAAVPAIVASQKKPPPPFWFNVLSGAVAGVIGTTVIFPLDMVKTRLQNQVSVNGVAQYSSAFDCAMQIVRKEGGVGALYRGISANLVGVTPEKAIKLAFNDFFRGLLADKNGHVSIPAGALAGGGAGFCQIVATNPMEIVKIRMQMAASSGVPASMLGVVSELGLAGLYKGASATLIRDIPFSMLMFCIYGTLRERWGDGHGNVTLPNALAAGLTGATIGASACTPMDVIKTRIQSKPLPGAPVYKTFGEAARGIMATEGPTAFFKGVVPRVCIIGPLFGIALVVYEINKKLFGF